jgi:hypothetical protein
MVLLSGTLATAAVCQSLCVPPAEPAGTMHHGGMSHMHAGAAAEAVTSAAMSASQCSTQVDARLARRATSAPQTRVVSEGALAGAAAPHFNSTASGQSVAVAGSPPGLESSSRAIPLRI